MKIRSSLYNNLEMFAQRITTTLSDTIHDSFNSCIKSIKNIKANIYNTIFKPLHGYASVRKSKRSGTTVRLKANDSHDPIEPVSDSRTISRLFEQSIVGGIPEFKAQEQEEDYDKMDLDKLYKSVDKNDIRAIYELGSRYYDGKRGVHKDNVSALNLFFIAYLHGFPNLHQNINKMMDADLGANNSLVKWLEKLANDGNKDAICSLGVMYSKGFCVEKNSVTAVKYFRKAAYMNHPEGMFYLGMSYSNGFGVDKNYTTAAKHYMSATLIGQVNAMHQLGRAYYLGQGVDKNKDFAKVYFIKAAQKRFEPSIVMLDKIQQEKPFILDRLLDFFRN